MQALLQQAFRYAMSLTHERHQAEDLLQEACRRLLEREEKISQGMLMKTIRHLFIDQYRRMKLVQFSALDEDEYSDAHDRALDALCARMEMESLLALLRPEERELLYLHLVEGWTCQEIAEFTERPRGTILSLIHRAKKTLVARAKQQDVAP